MSLFTQPSIATVYIIAILTSKLPVNADLGNTVMEWNPMQWIAEINAPQPLHVMKKR